MYAVYFHVFAVYFDVIHPPTPFSVLKGRKCYKFMTINEHGYIVLKWALGYQTNRVTKLH